MGLIKMSPGSWRYYAAEIAGGAEDYYAEAQTRGAWLGAGADALGLTAGVDAEALERLFGHGAHPLTGTSLGRPFAPEDERAVAGFGLTFSPPKTVSVVWATGDDRVATSIELAHQEAIRAAVAFLDTHAAFTRRGEGGIAQVDTDGLVAASFTHRTSRAGDPQLHTHVLVANKVCDPTDGAWRALDARELYRHQKAAGMLYKAALRAELSTRLGVNWTEVDRNGIAEIEGVPEALVDAWSSRRRAVIEEGNRLVAEREAEIGRTLSQSERADAFQLAAYRTRAPKMTGHEETATLRARWQEEAREWELDPEQWMGNVVHREATVLRAHAALRAEAQSREQLPELGRGAEIEGKSSRDRASISADEVLDLLADQRATFLRAHVAEVASTVVEAGSARAVLAAVEAASDAALASRGSLSLALPSLEEESAVPERRDGIATTHQHGAARFTTRTVLEAEAVILDAAAIRDRRLGVADDVVLEDAIWEVSLGEDQADAVRALCRGGERIALLVGPAGTGKSSALDAANRAWEESGLEVVGLAPSAMAARVLAEQSGIPSDTIAKFLSQGHQPMPDVIVVDEASMARTDDLAQLVRRTSDTRTKIVLVGDPNQLGAVGPGGIFRTLVADHGGAELETVRRFANEWEKGASLLLRAGDPASIAKYVEHDRISSGTRVEVLDAAFATWHDARAADESVVVMASDNATVEEIARRCRSERVRDGEVEHDGAPIRGGVAGVGDEVVTLANDRRLRTEQGEFVRNGARWEVVGRDDDGALALSSLDGHGSVKLPAAYAREEVALAYALTVHKAQGQTVARALVIVDDRTSAEQLYVGMTRGREENRALVVESALSDEHSRPEHTSARDLLVAALRRRGSEPSAHEVLRSAEYQAARQPYEPWLSWTEEYMHGPRAHRGPTIGM